MALIFSDNFNRADGPVGNDWVALSGGWTIAYQALKLNTGTSGVIMHAGTNQYPDAYAYVDWMTGNAGAASCAIYLRSNNNLSNAYYAEFYFGTTVPLSRISIGKVIAGAGTEICRAFNTPMVGNTHRCEFKASGSQLVAYMDGNEWLRTDNAELAGGDYFALYLSANGRYLDNFSISEALTYLLSANPNSVEAGSAGNQITLTGEANNWTPGFPGSPVFTCDIGTMVSQEIQTPSTAIVSYSAPGFVCTDTIRDPLNGTSVAIGIGQPVGGDIGEILRRLGNPTAPTNVTAYLQSLALPDPIGEGNTFPSAVFDAIRLISGDTDFATYLENIWNAIVTYPPAQANANSVTVYGIASSEHARTLGIDTNLVVHSLETNAHYSLLDVMNTLRGVSNIDNTNLWDYLHDLRTPNGYTLGDILLAIAALRGTDDRNLTEIYDLIDTNLPTDLSPVLTILNHLTATDTQTLQTVLNAIAALNNAPPYDDTALMLAIAAIAAALTAHDLSLTSKVTDLISNPAYGLHPIKDELEEVHSKLIEYGDTIVGKCDAILAAIQGLTLPGGGLSAPVWPGTAKATIGAGVPIGTGVTVTGPLHGVILHVTSVPEGTGRYVFDGNSSWTHAMSVTFVSDHGDFEYAQPIGFEHAIITPKSMSVAAFAVLRAKQALTGTVYPWTINP